MSEFVLKIQIHFKRVCGHIFLALLQMPQIDFNEHLVFLIAQTFLRVKNESMNDSQRRTRKFAFLKSPKLWKSVTKSFQLEWLANYSKSNRFSSNFAHSICQLTLIYSSLEQAKKSSSLIRQIVNLFNRHLMWKRRAERRKMMETC